MIYIIIVAGLLCLLLFLLWNRLRISFQWDEGGLSLSIRYLKVSYTIYSGSGGEISEGATGEDTRGKERLKKSLRWLKLIPDLLQATKTLVKLLGTQGRVTSLRLKGSIGADDPYLTGIYYGSIESLKGILEAFVPEANIDIRPNFEGQRFEMSGEGRAEIRLAGMILVSIIILWQLPKRQIWGLVRNS